MTCVWKGSHWLAIILLKFKKIKKKKELGFQRGRKAMRRGQSEKEDILLKRRVELLRKVRNSQRREGAKGLFAQGCLTFVCTGRFCCCDIDF